MAFFILTRLVLVKYSHAFVERPSQGTSSSLASRLTTASLDININIYIYIYIYISGVWNVEVWSGHTQLLRKKLPLSLLYDIVVYK